MKVGSIVGYIGGQDSYSQSQFKLEKDTPYVVTQVGRTQVSCTLTKPSIQIDAAPEGVEFLKSMFRELQKPMEISSLVEKKEERLEVQHAY